MNSTPAKKSKNYFDGISKLSTFGGALMVFAAVGPLNTPDQNASLFDLLWTRFIYIALGIMAMREGPLKDIEPKARWNIPALTAFAAFECVIYAHSSGERDWGHLLAIFGIWLLAWRSVDIIIAHTPSRGTKAHVLNWLVPIIFGATLLLMWETLCLYFKVPMVILPTPSLIISKLITQAPILGLDFLQTAQGILAGFVIGSGAGILVAILIDRVPFLQRGLLPLGNIVSALPIVGIAPIMVMWFGFDWQSKAAVVVVMTFFPQLVNTVAGLSAAGAMERDLMKTYAASYGQTLLSLRLPAALPFIFNGLKINSTLALIGAIVAEFFGTPILGMGFRINVEVGRMNIDMVWATIVVAAITGSLFYAALSMIERRVTFWHASYRQRA